MKNSQIIKKYAILTAMSTVVSFQKIIYTFLFFMLFTLSSAFCDVLVTDVQNYDCRVKFVSAGLIIANIDRSDFTFKRLVNNDYFLDEVQFGKYFFSRKSRLVVGRIENLDRWRVDVLTKDGGLVKIPRYKVKNIVMRVTDKGI